MAFLLMSVVVYLHFPIFFTNLRFSFLMSFGHSFSKTYKTDKMRTKLSQLVSEKLSEMQGRGFEDLGSPKFWERYQFSGNFCLIYIISVR